MRHLMNISITVTSHERQGVSNHRQIDCFLRNKNKKHQKYTSLVLYEGNRWPPRDGSVMGRAFPLHDVIMSCITAWKVPIPSWVITKIYSLPVLGSRWQKCISKVHVVFRFLGIEPLVVNLLSTELFGGNIKRACAFWRFLQNPEKCRELLKVIRQEHHCFAMNIIMAPGAGVTKVPFVNFSVREMFNLAKSTCYNL